MSYRLLIALGAGLISAVVFASATTGPLLMRMVLFLLTALPLFLAGLGLGPRAVAAAGFSGTLLVLVAGSPLGALVFAASQAIPAGILVYRISNRALSDPDDPDYVEAAAADYRAGRVTVVSGWIVSETEANAYKARQ